MHELPAPSPAPHVLFVLAHEVRTPLCAILGLADLLRDPPVPLPLAEQRELLDDIVAAALRLDRLLDDCVTAVQMGTGEIAIAPRRMPIEAAIARARIECGAPERVVVAGTASLPAVHADPDRIVQIVVNLLANALRASPPASLVQISALMRESELEIRVRDEGPGVEPALLPRLFEPFTRGANPSGTGLGLGLSLCRRLVEAHGGRLAYDDDATGATFVFTLPYAADPGATPPSD